MNVPTMDTVVAKLDQEGALFTLDEAKVLTREIERMESQLQATRRRAEAAEEVPMTLRTPSKDVMLVKEDVRSSHRFFLQSRARKKFGAGPLRTKECRYEHGPQIPLYLGSLPDNLH